MRMSNLEKKHDHLTHEHFIGMLLKDGRNFQRGCAGGSQMNTDWEGL